MKNKILFTFTFVVVVSFILIFSSSTPIPADCYCSDWHQLLGGCATFCANKGGCQQISVMSGGWCVGEFCMFLMEYKCVNGDFRTRFFSFRCPDDCNTWW